MNGENRASTGIPVVAVTPFATLGAQQPDALISEGLHADICGALTRFRSLRVVSPRSAAMVADLDDHEIGRRLGASHVLRGRLFQDGGRLRLSAGLVSCAEGQQLWDERLEAPIENFFLIQDELVGRIAATLNARIEEAALAEARRRPAASLRVHELTLRGLALLRQGTLESDEAARALFEQALALDPHHARAHAGIALSWFNDWSCQFWDRFEEASRQAYIHAHRALELDESDGMLHLVIGKVQLFRLAYEQAAWYIDRALALCPNDADLLVQASVLEVYLGRPEAGVEHIARAMRLDPYHPNVYYAVAAFVHFFARDFRTAIAMRERSDALPFVDAPAYCAAAFVYVGRIAEAQRELARYHEEYRTKIAFGAEVAPGAPLTWLSALNPFRRPEDLELVREGFRLLGEAPKPVPARAEPSVPAALLAAAGQNWIVEYEGHRSILPDLKGLHDIRRLLERPGEEVHCLDLAERAETTYGADAALDDRARNEIKLRIRTLQEELADAEDMNDIGRAEGARSEMDRLFAALSQALGLGGRSRRLGDLAERARTTVTWRIRYALRKIEAAHAPLGRHLQSSLRTGTFCVYCPEVHPAWRFDVPPVP
jgi:TolB-like protein